MLRKFMLVSVLLIALTAAADVQASKDREHGNNIHRSVETPSLAEVDHAITLAASYLEQACGPDGRFVYLVNIKSGQQAHTYNVVRHAGAIYALGMLHDSQPDLRATEAMLRATVFLRHNYIGPGISSGQLVVWSKPLPWNSDAELGATGLGIVALAAVKKVDPGAVSLEELESLGRFALFLQREDGSFVSKYRPDTGSAADFESLYYPGEAALGFISLYKIDHSQTWLDAAEKALTYLAKSRANLATVTTDDWALIATAVRDRYETIARQFSERDPWQYADFLVRNLACYGSIQRYRCDSRDAFVKASDCVP
jgi:hypothetical protein